MRKRFVAGFAGVGIALGASAASLGLFGSVAPGGGGVAVDVGVVVRPGGVGPAPPATTPPSRVRPFVIHISVDGLRSGDETRNLQGLIDRGEAPAFARLQREGLWTHNARTDVHHTNTLPNHTTMLTGRPVEDVQGLGGGHRYRWNDDPEDFPTSGVPVPVVNLSTLHTSAGEYVPSVFNVASDAGLSTALYVSKSKFSLYDQSYDGVDRPGDPAFEAQGADRNGADDGADKIDRFVYEGDIAAMTDRFLADLGAAGPADYSFLHFNAPDSAGHGQGWGGAAYLDAVRRTDAQLRCILDRVSQDPRLAGRVVIILSADHGGGGDRPVTDAQHGTPVSPLNFTIPFYVWGADIARGDLYAFNRQSRASPNPLLNPVVIKRIVGNPPPIRNGDGGNLALDLLGLGPIPGSALNALQDLEVRVPRVAREG